MSELLRSMYSTYDILLGGRQAPEPTMKKFHNWEIGCQLIKENLDRNGLFLLHGDVDVDGVFSAQIGDKWLKCITPKDRVGLCINNEKVHGISEKHIDYFSNAVGSNGLIIILDSSTNAVEYIKRMRCNVLVVDHHEVLIPIEELSGNTATGKYVVVNNMVGEDAETTMSGALVFYELLRLYQCRYLGYADYLAALKLYQYVGVTLFTDAIPLDTARNQWYVGKTIDSKEIETNLHSLVNSVNSYQHTLDKSFIGYNLAPMINRGVREGLNSRVLSIVAYEPEKINELAYLKAKHDAIKGNAMSGVVQYTKFSLKDISNTGINTSFCGLLAMKVLEETEKSSCCYIVENGMARGSFRGIDRGIDYRRCINALQNCKAEGHAPAFGFNVPVDYLADVINYVVGMETGNYSQPFMTVGPMYDNKKGKCHYDNMEIPKREQLIYEIAMINSRMIDADCINIVCANIPDNVKLISVDGKVYNYNVYGLECKAFEEIKTQYVEVYLEIRKGIECYVRPLKKY